MHAYNNFVGYKTGKTVLPYNSLFSKTYKV